MHDQTEFLIPAAAFDPVGPLGRPTHGAASTLNEAIAPSHRAARGQQRSFPMKSPTTIGPAVAVSLVAATVAALA